MINNDVIKEMIKNYKTYSRDWMGYKINKGNPLTYHHIEKDCDGGIEDITNGALLGRKSHSTLNIIEQYDIDLYLRWNKLFRVINQSKNPISSKLWQEIVILRNETDSFKDNFINMKSRTRQK